MSLNQEERNIMVGLELEKAKSTFAEHEGLTEKGYWNTLANRLYYALFHAVSAMLISDGREVGSHKGAAIPIPPVLCPHRYLYRRRGRVLLADGDPTREVRL